MRLPTKREKRQWEIVDIFRPYIKKEDKDKGLIYIKELSSNAPKEAQEAFKEWWKLEKEQQEEDSKIGIVF